MPIHESVPSVEMKAPMIFGPFFRDFKLINILVRAHPHNSRRKLLRSCETYVLIETLLRNA